MLRMVTVQRLYGSELEKKTASLILLAQVCVPILRVDLLLQAYCRMNLLLGYIIGQMGTNHFIGLCCETRG